ERPRRPHRDHHLRLPQRHAAGGDHAWHGVLLPARRQRPGGEGLRLAGHRLLCRRGADLVRLRAVAGLRAHHGGPLRGAQPDHRHSLRRHRSAREAGGMTDTAIRAAAPKAESNSLLRHARYVVSENPVTGLAFGLFTLIALCALIGPYIVPHDPLASDTAATLQAPSWKHWFGTDQLGRDIFSRVVVATRLDLIIALSSVALVFAMGGFAGIAAGFFGGWTDRIVGRISDTIMAFPLIVLATAIINFPLYVRVARAEANVRRDAGFVQAARLSGNGDFRILLMHILP